jgi:hypothetical protein
VEDSADAAILAELADADLLGLRLAAQIMAHKAELDGRARVADYFAHLESAVQSELASRLTGIRAIVAQPDLGLDEPLADEDSRLIAEYLGLLIANEQLSTPLRDACRQLRAAATNARGTS